MSLDPISIATRGRVCGDGPGDISAATQGYVCLAVVVVTRDVGASPFDELGRLKPDFEEEAEFIYILVTAVAEIERQR